MALGGVGGGRIFWAARRRHEIFCFPRARGGLEVGKYYQICKQNCEGQLCTMPGPDNGLHETKRIVSKVWFITGAGSGIGTGIAKSETLCGFEK